MIRFAIHYYLLFTMMATIFPYFQLFLRARGFSDAEVGYLQGVAGLAGVCGPMAVGYLADRLGRRKAALVGCLVAFAALLWPLCASGSFALSAVLVAAAAFAWHTTIPLSDTLASRELADPAAQYGPVRIWGSIGFVVALGGIRLLGLLDERSAGSMATGMLVTAALCLASALMLPDRRRTPAPRAAADRPDGAFDAVFWLFVLAAAMQRLGMSAYYSFFSMYLQDALAMDHAAWVWALGPAAEIALLFYSGPVIRRFGLVAVMSASMAAVTVRLGLLAMFPELWVVLPSQLLHGLTFGLFHAGSIEFLRRKVPARRRGLGMALYMSLGLALPALIGSALGGHVIEQWGYRTLYLAYAAPPLLGLACMLAGRRRLDPPAPPPSRLKPAPDS